MILFRPEHIASILEGRKTQTRRMGAKRWNVDALHQCRTRMLDETSCFARVRILDVRREQLLDITEEDARAEGYETRRDFLEAFHRINPKAAPNPEVWVVTFARVLGMAS